jgi:hypothetical protein
MSPKVLMECGQKGSGMRGSILIKYRREADAFDAELVL